MAAGASGRAAGRKASTDRAMGATGAAAAGGAEDGRDPGAAGPSSSGTGTAAAAAAGANAGVTAGCAGITRGRGIVGTAGSPRYWVEPAIPITAAATAFGQRRASEKRIEEHERRARAQVRTKPCGRRLPNLGDARRPHEIPPGSPYNL